MTRTGLRWIAGSLLLVGSTVYAAVDGQDSAERWWDASRADRIGFSDRAALRCTTRNCDSLQIRSCLNDTLKPPVSKTVRDKTIGQVTADCIARFSTRP